MTEERRFEGCPVCSTTSDYVVVDKTHWFYCKKHRTKWRLNLNAFESYRDTDNNPYTKEEKWAVLDAEARDIEDWLRD